MKKLGLVLIAFIFIQSLFAQNDTVALYKKTSVMIPMRDGIKLFTVIYSPVRFEKKVPILLRRTPYGSDVDVKDDSLITTRYLGARYTMARDGYVFVDQDIRGKYKSEGKMQIHQPLTHSTQKGTVDESTDTWDTIDWLIKNVAGNNGKAGIFGISYPGWLALVGAVDPHPALKASS